MNAHTYHIEQDEIGYMITSVAGDITCYGSIESAVAAMRELEEKHLPKHWNKVPPAIRLAKQHYYGAAA